MSHWNLKRAARRRMMTTVKAERRDMRHDAAAKWLAEHDPERQAHKGEFSPRRGKDEAESGAAGIPDPGRPPR